MTTCAQKLDTGELWSTWSWFDHDSVLTMANHIWNIWNLTQMINYKEESVYVMNNWVLYVKCRTNKVRTSVNTLKQEGTLIKASNKQGRKFHPRISLGVLYPESTWESSMWYRRRTAQDSLKILKITKSWYVCYTFINTTVRRTNTATNKTSFKCPSHIFHTELHRETLKCHTSFCSLNVEKEQTERILASTMQVKNSCS